MKLFEAKAIADKYVEMLKPFCKRIEIKGSIIRECPEVGDIEILCIRNTKYLRSFCDVVDSLRKVKGSPIGRYTQRVLPEGIKLDLFMCYEDNWGLISAIRTGSADYSHNVLAMGWVKAGFNSVDGCLFKNGKKVPVYEEEDLFKLIGLKFVHPTKRNL